MPDYGYQISTPITYNTIQAYNNGINAYIGSTQKIIGSTDFYNSVYEVFVNNQYNGNVDKQNNGISSVLSEGIGGAYATCCLPLIYSIASGTQITITGECCNLNVGNTRTKLKCGILDSNGVFIECGIFENGTYSNNTYNYVESTITFTLPFTTDRIYFYTDSTTSLYAMKNFVVSYYLTNLELLQFNSYDDGYKKAETELKEYYSYGGQGYQQIYNRGVSDAQSNSAVFSDTWTFIGTAFNGIGDMLSVELIPNVPIGVFVALPLLLGLIFFIVKLTKGGS